MFDKFFEMIKVRQTVVPSGEAFTFAECAC